VIDNHGLEAELGEFSEKAGCRDVENRRPGAVLRVYRVGPKEGGFNGGIPSPRVDEAADGGLPLTIEGGRPAGGDRPDALNIALNTERVGAFDGAFRTPRLSSLFLLCLRGGDEASPAAARADQEHASETTCG